MVNDDHCLAPDATAFPLRLKKAGPQTDLFSIEAAIRANLSDRARAYLAGLGIADPDSDAALENGVPPYALIWYHALAIGYSPAYLRENKDGIQSDWPRIPLPTDRDALLRSAALGQQVALTLTSQGVRGVFADVAVLRRVDGGQINPQAGDLALEAGWGHAQGNVVMPGQGKIVEIAIPRQVEESGVPNFPQQVEESGLPNLFGETRRAYDVYLNDRVYWHAIPESVWGYVIGGYQVIKKWLAYREKKLLGRDLTVAEAREVTAIARSLAALVALEPQLDENYRIQVQRT